MADGTTACTPIPEETAGPSPGDGSNGPNVLTESGVVRHDIRSSFGTSSTVAEGIPLTINLELLDTTGNCVQEADASGRVIFDSSFPAAYSGRWPQLHFEVYATAGYEQSVENMSQLRLPSDNVFGDDAGASQLGSVEGDVTSGYTVELTVPVDPTATSTDGAGAGGAGAPPGGGGGRPSGPPPSAS